MIPIEDSQSTELDNINEVRCRLVSADPIGGLRVGSLEIHRENLTPNSHIRDIQC